MPVLSLNNTEKLATYVTVKPDSCGPPVCGSLSGH